jgi:hypothetical protein
MKPHDDPAEKVSFALTDLAGLGLGQAFRKTVIEDPKFEEFRKAALAADPLFDFLYLHQHDHLWPVCPSRILKILNAGNAVRPHHWPPVTPVLAARARLDTLWLAFGDLFRDRQLEMVGQLVAHASDSPSSAHRTVTISPSIWTQERFFFHDLAGGIFENIIPTRELRKSKIQRWAAVAIQRPVTPGATVTIFPDKVRNSGGDPTKFNWGMRGR